MLINRCVDSHDDSRAVYSTILQHGGFAVLEARTRVEALEMVPKHMPDAVITEPTLPAIEGCEILRRSKQHPTTAHVPVLVVMAELGPEYGDRRSKRAAMPTS